MALVLVPPLSFLFILTESALLRGFMALRPMLFGR